MSPSSAMRPRLIWLLYTLSLLILKVHARGGGVRVGGFSGLGGGFAARGRGTSASRSSSFSAPAGIGAFRTSSGVGAATKLGLVGRGGGVIFGNIIPNPHTAVVLSDKTYYWHRSYYSAAAATNPNNTMCIERILANDTNFADLYFANGSRVEEIVYGCPTGTRCCDFDCCDLNQELFMKIFNIIELTIYIIALILAILGFICIKKDIDPMCMVYRFKKWRKSLFKRRLSRRENDVNSTENDLEQGRSNRKDHITIINLE